MTTILYYTADGQLTDEYAVDCVVQWSVEDATRLGLPVTREPAAAADVPEAKHIPAPPEDKAVRVRATKAAVRRGKEG